MDTNVAIDLLRSPETTEPRIHPLATPYLSVVVLGELYFGAQRSRQVERNMAAVGRLADSAHILECGHAIAHKYGEIRHALVRKGKPIPDNDIWIAATAIVHDLPVLTADAHFREIHGLAVAAW